jgi:LysM repeat protein
VLELSTAPADFPSCGRFFVLGFMKLRGLAPSALPKTQTYRPGRPTEKTSNFSPISTQFNDPRGKVLLAPRAKYSYISRVTRLGLFFVALGLLSPLAFAHASIFSYLGQKIDKIGIFSTKAEPQNSQRISFMEAATNVDPKKAMGGGDFTIVDDSALLPDAGPSGTVLDLQSNDRQGKVSLYVVRDGDTLPQIAKMFDVTVNTILWANDLKKNDTLRAGQTLVLLPVNGVQHIVQKGETLKGIAKKYQGNVDEIVAFNDLGSVTALSVGETIIIPEGTEQLAIPVSTGSSKIAPSHARAISRYPSYEGYYQNPLPTGQKTQGIHGYNGVDLGAPKGDPIYAAAEGTVIVDHFNPNGNPWFGGYGNYVVLEHPNGTQTLYAHMSAVYVSMGDHLSQGQRLGAVGSTGHSTGPHLHFEVRGAKNPGADGSWKE